MSGLPRWPLLLAALILAADQASKEAVLGLLLESATRQMVLADNLNFVTVWNRGVSFGLLASDAEWTRWGFTGFSVLVSVGLIVWLRSAAGRWLRLGIGLVVGGAIGNAVDRVRFGAVFDFVDVHVAGWHWPAFNLADAAIMLGAAAIMLDAFGLGRHNPAALTRDSSKPLDPA